MILLIAYSTNFLPTINKVVGFFCAKKAPEGAKREIAVKRLKE